MKAEGFKCLPGCAIALIGAGLLVGVPGCQEAYVAQPLTQKYQGDDPSLQLDFWHELATAKLTSNDDAFHGLLLYLDNADASTSYDQRVATLKSRGLLPGGFNQSGLQAVERGTVAYAIVKVLHLRGGWVMHLFGDSPRYAVKELVDSDIFPPSSPQQTFSGSEFVGVIGKLEDFQTSATAAAQ
jgi:hypothetical protein